MQSGQWCLSNIKQHEHHRQAWLSSTTLSFLTVRKNKRIEQNFKEFKEEKRFKKITAKKWKRNKKLKIKIRNNKVIGMNVKNYKAKSGNKVAKKLKKKNI